MSGVKTTAVLVGLLALAAAPAHAGSSPQEEKNKQIVAQFMEGLYGGKPDLIPPIVGPTFKSHDFHLPSGDRQSFVTSVQGFTKNTGGKWKLTGQKYFADGDTVVVHYILTPTEGKKIAAAEIFRLENGKLVQHWNAMAPEPDKPANPNGLF